jgi:hypothetical protein
MSKRRQRKSRTKTQETSAAQGTLVDARRTMQRAVGRGDKPMKIVIWGAIAMVAIALIWAVLAP